MYPELTAQEESKRHWQSTATRCTILIPNQSSGNRLPSAQHIAIDVCRIEEADMPCNEHIEWLLITSPLHKNDKANLPRITPRAKGRYAMGGNYAVFYPLGAIPIHDYDLEAEAKAFAAIDWKAND